MINFDEVQRPEHYNSHPSGVECIEVAEKLGFNLGNAFKYLFRSDLKHATPVTDLKKALFYVEREYARLGGGPMGDLPDLEEPQGIWFSHAFFFDCHPPLRKNAVRILSHETSWRAGAMAYTIRGSEFLKEDDLRVAAAYIRKAIDLAS